MFLRLPPPWSLFSVFFSSLVSSVRNPITVIKSADPQRALLQTAGEGGRHGGGEIWLEGKRWMESGFRERWWREGEMKRCMRACRKRQNKHASQQTVKKNTWSNYSIRCMCGPFTAVNQQHIHSLSWAVITINKWDHFPDDWRPARSLYSEHRWLLNGFRAQNKTAPFFILLWCCSSC